MEKLEAIKRLETDFGVVVDLDSFVLAEFTKGKISFKVTNDSNNTATYRRPLRDNYTAYMSYKGERIAIAGYNSFSTLLDILTKHDVIVGKMKRFSAKKYERVMGPVDTYYYG